MTHAAAQSGYSVRSRHRLASESTVPSNTASVAALLFCAPRTGERLYDRIEQMMLNEACPLFSQSNVPPPSCRTASSP
ncbi:hypothetical protein D1872_308840 [compost metagenome]